MLSHLFAPQHREMPTRSLHPALSRRAVSCCPKSHRFPTLHSLFFSNVPCATDSTVYAERCARRMSSPTPSGPLKCGSCSTTLRGALNLGETIDAQPFTLSPCGHSLCAACAEAISAAPRPLCPYCGDSVTVPSASNAALGELAEAMAALGVAGGEADAGSTLQANLKCTACSDEGDVVAASHRCDDCEPAKFFCDDHVNIHRRRFKHSPAAVATAASSHTIYCKAHPTSELYFFCMSCVTPVCANCIVLRHPRDSSEHRVVECADAAAYFTAELDKLRPQFDAAMGIASASIAAVSECVSKVDSDKAAALRVIEEGRAKLAGAVDTRFAVLKAGVEEACKSYCKELSSSRSALEVTIGQCGAASALCARGMGVTPVQAAQVLAAVTAMSGMLNKVHVTPAPSTFLDIAVNLQYVLEALLYVEASPASDAAAPLHTPTITRLHQQLDELTASLSATTSRLQATAAECAALAQERDAAVARGAELQDGLRQAQADATTARVTLDGVKQTLTLTEDVIVQECRDISAASSTRPLTFVNACVRVQLASVRVASAYASALSSYASSESDIDRKLAAGNDTVRTLFQVMSAHVDAVGVQEAGTAAVRNLLLKCDTNRREWVRLGGMPLTYTIAGRHINSVIVCRWICAITTNIALVDEDLRRCVLSAGGVSCVLTAMSRFPEDAELQDRACGACWATCYSPEGKAAMLAAGAVEKVRAARARHPGNRKVQEQSGGALKELGVAV